MGIWLHKILTENNESNIPHVLEESQFVMFNLWEKTTTIGKIDEVKLDTSEKTTSRATTPYLFHY